MLLPNPFTLLQVRASIQPHAVAVEDVEGGTTYAACHAMARRIARRLRRHGVRPGQLVVTRLDMRADWVFTLALLHEATVSCSYRGAEPLPEALGVDWLVSGTPLAGFPRGKTILVDEAWLRDVQRDAPGDDEALPYPDADSLCRMILTSGTTGQPKGVPYTVGMVERRLQSDVMHWIANGDQVNLMPLLSVGGYFTAFNSLLTGKTYYCARSPKEAIALVRARGLRGMAGSPAQWTQVVAELEASGVRLDTVKELRCAGGPLPDELLAGLRRHFDADIYKIYGSTECGGMCLEQVGERNFAQSAGFALPFSQVEAVDESHRPLPAGEEGSLRIRSESMASRYHNDAAATASAYRDGWFYPGDRGFLAQDGRLLLVGRDDEIINSGGLKINPALIDHCLLDHAGVQDAAVFGVRVASGIVKLGAAVVAAPEFDMEALRRHVNERLGGPRTPVVWLRVQSIPRNELGKVMRARMTQRYSRLVARRSGATDGAPATAPAPPR